MTHRAPLATLRNLTFLAAVAGPALAQSTAASSGPTDLAELFPERTQVFVEGPGLSALFEAGLAHSFVARLLESELGAALLEDAEATPEEMLAFLGEMLGAPVLETLSTLTDRGVALGFERGFGVPKVTVIARSDDELLMETMLEKGLAFFAQQQGKPELAQASDEILGVDVWYPLPVLGIATFEGTLLASTDEYTFRHVLKELQGRDGDGQSSLKESTRWSDTSRDGDELFWGWVDLEALGRRAGSGAAKLQQMTSLPQVHMLLGSGVAMIGRAAALTGELRLGADALSLQILGQGLQPGAATPLLPGSERGRQCTAPRMPEPTPNELARLVAYRDFGGIFAHRATLFPPDLLPKFTKASSELAPVLGGMDLGEDLLPGLSPWVRAVAREVRFRPDVVPEIVLPAAALLVELDEPATMGPRLVSSFQTTVGVANLERAQQGAQPMLLELSLVDGVQVSAARFLPPGPEDGVDIVYNLEPACCVVGDTFVLASHVELVKELVAQLKAERMQPVSPTTDRLTLDGPRIADALRANFEALVMNGVVNEGKELETARREMRGLVALVEMIERGELVTQYLPGGVSIELSLRMTPEAPRRNGGR